MKVVFQVCQPVAAAGLEVPVMLDTMLHGGLQLHMILFTPGTGDYTLINQASEAIQDIKQVDFQFGVFRIECGQSIHE